MYKTVMLDGYLVGLELLYGFLFLRMKIYSYWLLQAKTLGQKALNYIPTSCSNTKFLILVTFLNLAPYIRVKRMTKQK